MSSARLMAQRPALRRILAMVALLGSLLCGQAHGPFDNSSLLILHDDTLEVVVTMGMDGARQFLLHAGLPEPETTTALAGRGPATGVALAVDLAAKCFEVDAGGKPLLTQRVSVMTDGLEAAFTISYPRPSAESLFLRALYFTGVEMMRPGSFIATVENRNALGAAMLSRAKASVEIRLSPIAPITPPLVEPPKRETHAALSARAPVQSETRSASSPRDVPLPPYIWILALVLAVTAACIAARKWMRSH